MKGLLGKLFGGGSAENSAEPETYEGFLIFPNSAKDGTQYRLGARIEKEIGGEVRVHQLVRADMFTSAEAADSAAVMKAKRLIDEQGERIFG